MALILESFYCLQNRVSPFKITNLHQRGIRQIIHPSVNGLIILLKAKWNGQPCLNMLLTTPVTLKIWTAAVVKKSRAELAPGNIQSWAYTKLSTNSTVTQLSTYKEPRDPDVNSACAVTTPLPLNIKVSCSGYCGSSHLTITAIAHGNDSPENKPLSS